MKAMIHIEEPLPDKPGCRLTDYDPDQCPWKGCQSEGRPAYDGYCYRHWARRGRGEQPPARAGAVVPHPNFRQTIEDWRRSQKRQQPEWRRLSD